MVNFSFFTDHTIFYFDEITNVSLIGNFTAGTKTCKWTDDAFFRNFCAIDNTICFYFYAITNHRVSYYCIRADTAVTANFDMTFENNINVDYNISAMRKFTAQIKTRRI